MAFFSDAQMQELISTSGPDGLSNLAKAVENIPSGKFRPLIEKVAGGYQFRLLIVGSQEECLKGVLSESTIQTILQIRIKLLERYSEEPSLSSLGAYGDVRNLRLASGGITSNSQSPKSAFYLGLLKFFSNNLVTLHCPEPVGNLTAVVK